MHRPFRKHARTVKEKKSFLCVENQKYTFSPFITKTYIQVQNLAHPLTSLQFFFSSRSLPSPLAERYHFTSTLLFGGSICGQGMLGNYHSSGIEPQPLGLPLHRVARRPSVAICAFACLFTHRIAPHNGERALS